MAVLAKVRAGGDPAADRDGERSAVTVARLCDEYLAAGEGRIKASTLTLDKGRIARHVKPLLGRRAAAGLKPSDIEKFMNDIIAGKTATKVEPGKRKPGGIVTGGKATAARTVEMLGTILQRAVKDGIMASNPVRGVKKPKIEPRQPPFSFKMVEAVGKGMRELQDDEVEEFKALRASTQTAMRAIRFLMLSGCRRMEALTLQWGDVDFAGRCLRFRDTKTGRQIRPIGRAALDFLASFRPDNSTKTTYVFPGEGKDGHYVALPKKWALVAERASVEDVSIHGLRHWFASAAAEMNYSDFVIGGLLGHAKQGITGRYANTPDSALCAAADRVALKLLEALDGTMGAKVVSIAG
jgi:integrase